MTFAAPAPLEPRARKSIRFPKRLSPRITMRKSGRQPDFFMERREWRIGDATSRQLTGMKGIKGISMNEQRGRTFLSILFIPFIAVKSPLSRSFPPL